MISEQITQGVERAPQRSLLYAAGFTEDEIARAKEQLKAGIIMDLENTASRMKFLAKREIYGGGERNSDEIVKKVDAVTADDVRRVLSRFRLSVCYTLTKEAGADA